MLRNRCLVFLSAAAVSLGVACGSPDNSSIVHSGSTQQAVKSGYVFHAPATKTSIAKLGINRWHALIEPTSGAVVVDGADGHGKVKFTTVMRVDKAKQVLHLDSYKQAGSIAIDMKTGKILSSTLPHAEWAQYAKAFVHDWAAYKQTVPYGAWGYVAAGLAVVAGAAGVVAAVAAAPAVIVGAGVVAGVAGVASAVSGAVELYNSDKTSEKQQQQLDNLQQQVQQLQQNQQQQQQQNQQQDPQTQNPQQQDPQQPTDPNSTPTDPNTQNDPNATNDPNAGTTAADKPVDDPNPTQGQDLPADNTPTDNGNLTSGGDDPSSGGNVADNTGGGADPSSGGNVADNTGGGADPSGGGNVADNTGGGADNTGGGADPSGGVADNSGGGGDTGGGDVGGGDTGGGADYAAGTCRVVSCSKSSKVCVCGHY